MDNDDDDDEESCEVFMVRVAFKSNQKTPGIHLNKLWQMHISKSHGVFHGTKKVNFYFHLHTFTRLPLNVLATSP